MSYISALRGVMSGVPGTINPSLPNSGTIGTAVYSVQNDGVLAYNGGSATTNWVTPAVAGVAMQYQVRVHVNSGSFGSGPAADTWLDCSTTRTWTRTLLGAVNFDISFREKSTQIVRTTQTITMTAAA